MIVLVSSTLTQGTSNPENVGRQGCRAVIREEVHTSSIPGLCRCPGDEQQEEQEEERCLGSHVNLPREGRLHTALITE
jgi:hypothetical protein